MEKEIIKLYTENKLSLRKISKLTNCSTSFISKVLQEKGVYDYKNSNIVKKEELKTTPGKKIVAICKETGKVFEDYKNQSGSITNYIKEKYPEYQIPTSFKRRQYKYKTGKFWFENLLEIKEIKKEKFKTKKCHYCDWTTKDLENKSGAYINHIKKEHKLSIEEHLKNNPEDEKYFNTYKKRTEKQRKELESKEEGVFFIICKICGKKLKRMTDTHLKKHNISMLEYKMEYPNEPTFSKNSLEIQKNIYEKGLKHVKNNFTSKAQTEINELIKEFNIKTLVNDKKFLKGTEIDILIPDKKIGIEYNGNLYHSEIFGKKPRQFHKHKTDLMNNNSFGLIHIFEDEWELNKELVKTKIKHILNINSNTEKIHTRKCKIKVIESYIKNNFLNKNHIQGEDRSNVHLGAFYEDKLISIMTFDNKRQMNVKNNSEKTYELKRFCVDNNYSVPGMANKLLKHFIVNYNPEKIISFADIRWTLDKDNNLYTKLGFKLINTLGPDFFYYNPKLHRHKRIHKFAFGKKSIKKKYPQVYNDSKTEWEMMQELGFDRIWDCGKFKYELNC